MKAAASLFALLAACGQQSATVATNDQQVVGNELPSSKPAQPPPVAFNYDEKNDLIDFHFGWSAEAAAVPQLVKLFQAEMAREKAGLVKGAEEDKLFRSREKFEFHGHMSSTEYQTAGQSERVLILRNERGSYTGGAHGNSDTVVFLWDRTAAQEIAIGDLFAEPANLSRLLTQRWCDALNKEREEKRGEPLGGEGMFNECPKLDEIAIIPTDKDRNGKFERLTLVASPYVAGPWAEGSYEIDLAVTPDLSAAVKDEFRASFEALQTQ